MLRMLPSLMTAVLLLVGCAGNDPMMGQNCAPPANYAGRSLPWGYYPGYGCGPVPPARTLYP